MIQARHSHTATLLNNGKVLIAGGAPAVYGSSFFALLASAELYDTWTGTFTAAGEMTARRLGHTTTLLSNGKVLIDGSNIDGPGNEHFAELYDPDTNTFNATARGTLDSSETATLLMNGKVFVTRSYAGSELYDPSTAAFSPTSQMGDSFRIHYTATLLPDGTILIAGGNPESQALLYEPLAGRFSPAGDVTIRGWHTATLLADGAVLIAGGYAGDYDTSLNSAELYKPALSAPAPVLFALSRDGRGQGAIWHAVTGQVASPANAADAGSVLAMYTTSLVDGGCDPAPSLHRRPTGRGPVFWQRSGVSRFQPSELSSAGRRCVGVRRSRAVDVPRTCEQ